MDFVHEFHSGLRAFYNFGNFLKKRSDWRRARRIRSDNVELDKKGVILSCGCID